MERLYCSRECFDGVERRSDLERIFEAFENCVSRGEICDMIAAYRAAHKEDEE